MGSVIQHVYIRFMLVIVIAVKLSGAYLTSIYNLNINYNAFVLDFDAIDAIDAKC